jgi:glutamine cyclotransferase
MAHGATDWSNLSTLWDGTNTQTLYNTAPIVTLSALPALTPGSADIGTVNTKYKPTTPTASYYKGATVSVGAGDATKTSTITLDKPFWVKYLYVASSASNSTNTYKIERYNVSNVLQQTVVVTTYDKASSEFPMQIPMECSADDYLKLTYTNTAGIATVLVWNMGVLWTGLNPWGTAIANYATTSTNPQGMAFDGTYLWVLSDEVFTGKIYKVDPSDGSEISSISLSNASWAALDYFNGYLYAGENTAPAQVHKINPTTGIDEAQWNGQGSIQGLANDGTYMYQISFSEKTIYKLNPADGAVIDSWNINVTAMLGLAWDGAHLLMCSSSTDLIYKLDFEAQTTIATVALATDNATGLAYDGTNIWYCDHGTLKIYKVQG